MNDGFLKDVDMQFRFFRQFHRVIFPQRLFLLRRAPLLVRISDGPLVFLSVCPCVRACVRPSVCPSVWHPCPFPYGWPTVRSHNFSSQKLKLRVSNLRTIVCFHFNMPFESANLPATGPIFPDWTFWKLAVLVRHLQRTPGTHRSPPLHGPRACPSYECSEM